MTSKEKIEEFGKNMTDFLKEKNRRYGDSVLQPKACFGKHKDQFSDTPEMANLLLRIDEKLNRIENADELKDNDVIDIIGYLTILMIGQDKFDEGFFNQFLD